MVDSGVTAVLDEAIADANRTLSKKNKGDGYFKIVSVEVKWLRYDPELDELVPATKPITYVP